MATLAEFLEVAREELQFLRVEFGFLEESIEKCEHHNEFSVRFANDTTVVFLSGIGWGSGVNVRLGRVDEQDGYIPRGIPLWSILELRAPSEDPNKGVQLDQIRSYARMLRKYASDVLQGDFSVIPAAKKILDDRIAELRRIEDENEYERASIRASNAFHQKEFEKVEEILAPFSGRLSKHQTQLISYCEKQKS